MGCGFRHTNLADIFKHGYFSYHRFCCIKNILWLLKNVSIWARYLWRVDRSSFKVCSEFQTSHVKSQTCYYLGRKELSPRYKFWIASDAGLSFSIIIHTALGEIVLGDESKIFVAKRASPSLIQMVHSGNPLTRKATFDALLQISSYPPNAKALVEAGIIKLMIEEMFIRRIYDEAMNSK